MKLTLDLCFNGWIYLVLIYFQNVSENVRWFLLWHVTHIKSKIGQMP